MNSVTQSAIEGYTPAGDVTVLSICLLVFIMLTRTSVSSKKRFRLAILMVIFTVIACLTNMGHSVLVSQGTFTAMPIYLTRLARHIGLAIILFSYNCYLDDPLWIPANMRKRNYIASITALFIASGADALLSLLKIGYYIAPDGSITNGKNVYTYLFLFYLGIIFYRIIIYRKRIIRKVYWCMLFSNLLCVIMMAVQGRHHQTSFTSVAFFLPVLCLIFIFHSNPYDTDTGALSEKFFYEDLNNALEKKKTMIIISLHITDFFKNMKESKELRKEYRNYFRQNFQYGTVYRFANDQLVYVFPKTLDQGQYKYIDRMLKDFSRNYEKFEIDYKIVLLETTDEIATSQDYMKLIYFAENKTEMNSSYYVEDNDIKNFNTDNYILRQLEDINHSKDLNDPRVLVYCQPVYNINTGIYDTAEALMRLRLDRTGLIYPDQFIPLAEQNGFIHTMSMIILNKTCAAISKLTEAGYHINRVSVNFTTIDLRYDSFCDEVRQIIMQNHIPFGKIAMEITESLTDSDFNIMVQKVTRLQKMGIKFYLDDFGTGYSNFERIMKIPFDIIKFDRSLVIESSKDPNSFYMVSTFAGMFSQLNYSILFEGIENDDDEAKCKCMNASYLQGYKYSRPIPIEQLREFLSMENANNHSENTPVIE